jgi:hypothetical protein
MRYLAMKPKSARRGESFDSAPNGQPRRAQSRAVNSLLNSQTALRNQAVPRPSEEDKAAVEVDSTTKEVARFGHDFSRMPVHATTPLRIQPKLTVNAPGDVYEQEADSVAERVMQMSEPQLMRKCACGGECSKCRNGGTDHEYLQAKHTRAGDAGGMAAPPVVHEALSSSGRPLDSTTRAFFEQRFGHDFGKVRVHSDELSAAAASAVNAKAFTVGNDIVFGDNHYSPMSDRGRWLLAHELTHVVQQEGGVQKGGTRGGRLSEVSASVSRQPSRDTLAREEETSPTPGGGCRRTTETPCPGTKGQLTRIEYFPSMYLKNLGTCPLFVAGLDSDGEVIDPTAAHFELQPGDGRTFNPPEGATAVGFACLIGCDGVGRLEHPYLCA